MTKIVFLFLSFLTVSCLGDSEAQNNIEPADASMDAQAAMSTPAGSRYDVCEQPVPISISTPPPVECDRFGKYLDREDPEKPIDSIMFEQEIVR